MMAMMTNLIGATKQKTKRKRKMAAAPTNDAALFELHVKEQIRIQSMVC
jgi:hypothetical protein